MRKLGVFILGVATALTCSVVSPQGIRASAKERERVVYVGGMSAGFTLKTEGAQIIGTCEVVTADGPFAPARVAGLRSNDRIIKANHIKIHSITDLNEIVNKSDGKTLELDVARGEERLLVAVTPKKEAESERYKIGVLIRDCVSGVGTVTYVDKASGRFGSLGHSVVGEDKKTMQISDGKVYECSIVGVHKGVRGKAGELRGLFLNDKELGQADKLCDCGIFGQISASFKTDELMSVVASSKEVTPGNACIYSTISGVSPQKYDVEIVKVDKNNRENKNYVIKIKDEGLISETGGIVQGMSGSPILQDGKLVGAITHVFLNDPTRGYGIDIENMLRE